MMLWQCNPNAASANAGCTQSTQDYAKMVIELYAEVHIDALTIVGAYNNDGAGTNTWGFESYKNTFSFWSIDVNGTKTFCQN